ARHDPRRVLLLDEELDQVVRGAAIEVVLRLQLFRGLLDGPTRERADRLAELLRPADPVALPERHRPRQTGRRRHDHAVAADLLNPPRGRTEQERLTWARLV